MPTRKLLKPITLATLALWTVVAFVPTAWSEAKSPLLFVAEGEALGGYSETTGHGGTGSTLDNWLVSPTLKLNDSLYWINLYNGSYNHSSQVVAQDEGGRRAQTTQEHDLTTSLKYNVNETWSLRPIFFADWVFVNETKDESFGNGLYDYRDIGGGIESAWVTLKTEERFEETRLGFRYLDRQYPNYHSLLSLFDPNGSIENNEKDLNGYKINLTRDVTVKNGWSWGLEGIFFYKDFTDKKTVNSNGIRTGSGREDTLEYINANIAHPLGAGWTFRLDGQAAFNQSNLDFYDTRNTATFADDNFLPDYFDYTSLTVKPSFTYRKNLGEEKDFILTLDYAFNALLYSGRKAQNVSGVYKSGDEEDYSHTFSGKTSYPITKNVSWVVYGSYTIADSNQEFENFYLYNYDLWTAVTGVSLKF